MALILSGGDVFAVTASVGDTGSPALAAVSRVKGWSVDVPRQRHQVGHADHPDAAFPRAKVVGADRRIDLSWFIPAIATYHWLIDNVVRRFLCHAHAVVLAAFAIAAPLAAAHPHPSALPTDAEGILNLVIEIARHGDLRDIAFIERTFNIALTRQEWRGTDNTALGHTYQPTILPFGAGGAVLSLLVRTLPTALLPTGEYELGELYISLIDTVRCISRQGTERLLASAFGQKAPVLLTPDRDGLASLFGAVADKDRTIYVNAIFDRKADCLTAIDIVHRH